jgi:hypothetical protein
MPAANNKDCKSLASTIDEEHSACSARHHQERWHCDLRTGARSIPACRHPPATSIQRLRPINAPGFCNPLAWFVAKPPNDLGVNAVVCTRVRAMPEALSAATIALEISSRNGCAPAWI